MSVAWWAFGRSALCQAPRLCSGSCHLGCHPASSWFLRHAAPALRGAAFMLRQPFFGRITVCTLARSALVNGGGGTTWLTAGG